MPLTPYHRFKVHAVVAQCSQGLPIPPDALTEIAAVSFRTTEANDPLVSAWGVYGVLFDQSEDHLADCPTQALAIAIADTLNLHHGKHSV